MKKRRKNRTPRVVLLDTRSVETLQGQIDELRANVGTLLDVARSLGDTLTMMIAELQPARELMRIASETAQVLQAVAMKRSDAARRAGATRRQQAEATPPASDNDQAEAHAAEAE